MEKLLFEDYKGKGLKFTLGTFTPRNNEYERGLRYFLVVNGFNTDYRFASVKEAKQWVQKNYFVFL